MVPPRDGREAIRLHRANRRQLRDELGVSIALKEHAVQGIEHMGCQGSRILFRCAYEVGVLLLRKPHRECQGGTDATSSKTMRRTWRLWRIRSGKRVTM